MRSNSRFGPKKLIQFAGEASESNPEPDAKGGVVGNLRGGRRWWWRESGKETSAMEETLVENTRSATPPLIFIIVVGFQFVSRWLEHLKKRGVKKSATATRLRGEIKELLKEASSLSQPSTFAQAAKLRRLAAAKEKELANYQELHGKEKKNSYDLYLKVLFISKVLAYVVLVCCFWRVPVASISQQLVQPFGKVISWRAGGVLGENVMVGIIPWLILSTRVSKFVCRIFKF